MRQDLYDRIVDYIVENQDKFYRLAYSYVHNKEDALDIVQSAVLKALDIIRRCGMKMPLEHGFTAFLSMRA